MLHDNIAVVILAAGEGKRMKSGLPKVMHLLHDKPLIDSVVSHVEQADVTEMPIVVVSAKHTLVQEYLKNRAYYVIQWEQLGTGHAVAAARREFETAEHVIVLYGDMPFVQPSTIKLLAQTHVEEKNIITLTIVRTQFNAGTGSPLYDYGRIIRNDHGDIVDIVELKDATPDQALITELNTAWYCFQAEWLRNHVDQLRNENAQREFYLTDLVKIAVSEGQKIGSISIQFSEAIGINSKEDLDLAQKYI